MKIALVTGATSGFGKAVAELFCENGYTVYGFGRNIPSVNTKSIRYIVMDVTDDISVNTALKQVFSEINSVDVLVNCAGHGIAGPSEEIPIESVIEAFNVNFFGTIRVTNKVIPYLRKNKKSTLVNFSSIAGFIGLPFQAYYSATKHAIEGYSESLSVELKPFGIKVILIQPGDYKTGAARNRNVHLPDASSIYSDKLVHFFDYLNTRIDKGGDPKRLAKRVVKISESSCPKLRYTFGTPLECVSKWVHVLLPSRLWERIIQVFYKI